MLMIMREKKYARKCAVKVLDYVLTNNATNCDRCIDAGGLKSIFPIFMGRGLKKKYYEKDEIQKMEGQTHRHRSTACCCCLPRQIAVLLCGPLRRSSVLPRFTPCMRACVLGIICLSLSCPGP